MSALLRQANRDDVRAMQRIRAAVRENVLVSRVIGDDEVIEHIETLGRGWVIDLDGEIAGFAIANGTDGTVWALFVDPMHEGRGYGRRLHDEMVAWLWQQGWQRIRLSTEPGTRAQRFYTAAGWTETGRTDTGEAQFELHRTT